MMVMVLVGGRGDAVAGHVEDGVLLDVQGAGWSWRRPRRAGWRCQGERQGGPGEGGRPAQGDAAARLAGVADVQAVRVGRIVERLAEGDGEISPLPVE